MDTVCDYTFRGENAGDSMGSSIELFDIDNDGFDDVIVGARYARNFRGAVYIWWGGKDFDGNKPADIVLEGEPGSNMGGDDIVCGHFNNDSYGDILVGAYNYPSYPIVNGRVNVFYGNNRDLMDTDFDYIFNPEEPHKYLGLFVSAGDVNNDGYIDALMSAPGGFDCSGKAFLYFGPLVTEDIQDEIKAQQARVIEVEKELSDAKQKLEDALKFVPSSAGLEEVFEGLPGSLRRFLTPELEQLHTETVASIRDDSYVLHEGIRENQIGMSDIQLSAYIDEWTSKIDDLESRDNRNKEQEEELEALKEQLSWFEKVKYVPQEERDSRRNLLYKEMTMLRGN